MPKVRLRLLKPCEAERPTVIKPAQKMKLIKRIKFYCFESSSFFFSVIFLLISFSKALSLGR
ncbi:MAG: hypothetical protein E3J53_01500 [Desulfobacteraceae bacterium]|nr:MAG: hypothetical protein E3J53_01500 [Desulfobacteraceae bacterium]